MKKIICFLSVILMVVSMTFMSSCDKTTNKGTFNFDDKYFIGMQEHFYEIRAMEKSVTTDFICDLNEAIGSKVFRLNVTMNNLFVVDKNDVVKFNASTKAQMRIIVDKLLASGVERIVYATDSFLYPYGYNYTHPICAPDPYSERDAYERWLKVNSTGYGMMAKEFPEIRYFEPINEPDIPNNEVLCKNGMIWGTQAAQFMYSQQDEANILVDLCYYIRKEIKNVSPECMMTTGAFSALDTTYDYLEYCYQAIESGCHPTGDSEPCSVNPDDYFDIINLHPYSTSQYYWDPETPTESGITLITDTYTKGLQKFYDICVKHGDAEKPHWYTEIGFTDKGSVAAQEVIGREVTKQLNAIKNNLPFVECVIFYVMTDHYEFSVSLAEDNFGLFTAVANPSNPLQLKPIMKSIYKYMHNGSEDYSAFDTIRAKYCK